MKPEISSAVNNEQLKQRSIAIKIDIGSSATPANKTLETNLPGVAVLRVEGITAAADAVEDLSSDFATAADSTGVFGLLIDGSDLGINDVEQVLEVRTFVESGTLAPTSPSAGSDVTSFVSTEGNIAIDLDSSLDLSSSDLSATVIVTYKLA